MGSEPGTTSLEVGAQPHGLHPPSDAAWVFARARDELVERALEELALAHRREERERRDDRRGGNASLDGLRDAARGEPPQPAPQRAELRGDRFFGESRERAKGTDSEQAEAAVGVGIEG